MRDNPIDFRGCLHHFYLQMEQRCKDYGFQINPLQSWEGHDSRNAQGAGKGAFGSGFGERLAPDECDVTKD